MIWKFALVKVVIFDIMGRKVKILMNESQSSGYHSILWDATNDMGEDISEIGMYIYTILLESIHLLRKWY